jgi:hypothetical protein
MYHYSCQAAGISKETALPLSLYRVRLATSQIKLEFSVNNVTEILKSLSLLHCYLTRKAEASSGEEGTLTERNTIML